MADPTAAQGRTINIKTPAPANQKETLSLSPSEKHRGKKHDTKKETQARNEEQSEDKNTPVCYDKRVAPHVSGTGG